MKQFHMLKLRADDSQRNQAVTDHSVSSIVKIIDANKATLNSYDARISRIEKECRIPDVRPCSVTTCTVRIDKDK